MKYFSKLLTFCLLFVGLQAMATDYTNQTTSFTSTTLPSGWGASCKFYSDGPALAFEVNDYVQVSAATLFGDEQLSTDMKVNFYSGIYGTWSGNKAVTYKVDFLNASGNVLTTTSGTASSLTTSLTTNRGYLTVAKPSDPSKIAYLRVTITKHETGTYSLISKLALTYSTAKASTGDTTGGTTTQAEPTKKFSLPTVEKTVGDPDFTHVVATSPAGLTLTYKSSNTSVATVNANTGLVHIVGAGTATITATSAATSAAPALTAQYTLKVATTEDVVENDVEKILDGTFDFTGNNAYGSGAKLITSSGSYETTEKTWTADQITMTANVKYRWWKGKSGNDFRTYKGATLVFKAPEKGTIKKIVFTTSKLNMKASTGTLSSKTWTGSASSVTFTDTGNSIITKIVITYSAPVKVAIDYSMYNTLYSSTKNLVVPRGAIARTYDYKPSTNQLVATETYYEGDVIPAGVGVLVAGYPGTYYFEQTDEQPSTPATSMGGFDKAQTQEYSESGQHLYSFGQTYDYKSNKYGRGFARHNANGTIPASATAANQAFLRVPLASSPADAYNLGDNDTDATAIESVIDAEKEANEMIYTLDGRRTNKAGKGIHIINGKKVLTK